MEFEEARARFHDGEWDSEDDQQEWEPDMSKVRGAVMKWAKEKDTISGLAPEPEMRSVQADIKAWLKDRLGDGAHAVIRTHDYSRAGFERLSADDLGRSAVALYANNDEFRSIVDDKWAEGVPDSVDEGEDSGAGDYISRASGTDVISDFFHVYDDSNMDSHQSRYEPKDYRFKYFIKRYVMECTGIPADTDSPGARELATCWVDWIRDELDTVDGYLVHRDRQGDPPGGHSITVSNIEEWCRELWEEDTMFREHVIEKWGVSVDDSEADSDDEPEFEPIDRPEISTGTELQGQLSLDDIS